MKKFISLLFLSALAVVGFAHIGHVPDFNLMSALKTSGLSLAYATPMFISDNARQRAVLGRVTDIASKVGKFIITPAYIRSELVISNSLTTYNFEVRDLALQAGNPPRPLVRGIKDNDLAFAYDIGLFIDNRTTGTNTNVVLQSYPSYQAFNGSGATPSHLQAFYNGELTAQVGSTVFIANYSTYNFYKAPVTQQSGANNLSDFDLNSSLKSFDPYLIISGRADNQLVVNIKTFSGFSAAATTGSQENVLTFYANVMIVKNGANEIDRFQEAVNNMNVRG